MMHSIFLNSTKWIVQACLCNLMMIIVLKLPKFTDDVLHITKTFPESSFDNQKNIQAKKMNFHMDFEPMTQWSEVKGEITHHYLQFINAYLSERVQQVEKLKKFKNELENEIESLQSNELSNLV